MDANQLYRYIISLPSNKRINLLINKTIKQGFLSDDAHYPFVWLV